MAKLKPCPFCGNKIVDEYPHVYRNEKIGEWVLYHNCPHPHRDLSIIITLYADTREELEKRWNNRDQVKKNKGS